MSSRRTQNKKPQNKKPSRASRGRRAARQPANNGTPEPSVTALHEAAHAVGHAHISPGHFTIEVSIVPDRGTLGRHVPSDGWDDPQECERYVLACLAGLAAELHVGVPSYLAGAHANRDLALARDALGLGDDDDHALELWVARAGLFVEAAWSQIVRVARQLDEHKTLDDVEVALLIEEDEVALERYRAFRDVARKPHRIERP